MNVTYYYTVSIIPLTDDPETGIWCPHCNLPSALAVPYVLEHDGAMIGDRIYTVTMCDDCGRTL